MHKQVTIGGDDRLRVTVSSLGAALHRLQVPTAGALTDVILRYRDPADYLNDHYYMGALIGRFAGRIDSGRFRLGSAEHILSTDGDEHGHCLHGGPRGFHRQNWSMTSSADACELTHVSSDGEEGFPGELRTRVRYEVAGMRLIMRITASCTAPTVVNLTQHAYFNLSGEPTIDEHQVCIDADRYVPLDDNLIPVGRLAPVDGTQLDLRRPTRLADCFAAGCSSFDTFYVRNGQGLAGERLLETAVASLVAPTSGLQLNLYTTQPGVQFYTGHYLDGEFGPRQGLSLEAQGFPDAPNQPAFPSAALMPDQTYTHTTVFEFRVSG